MSDNWQLKAVLSANSAGMVKALADVGKMAKTTRKYLLDVGKSAGKLSGQVGLPFALIGTALAGFSVMGIKNAVVGFTELGESVYKASLRTGMSVEQLQRMKYVSEQAGVPVEALEGGIGKLNKNIGMAAAGKSKDLAALFKKLGISARDSNGQLKGGMDILPQLADAFQRNKNPVVQARMGMALFGKTWQEMIPLLAEGSEGITQSLERFKRLKGVMSFDDIKGAKELGDKFKDLNMVTKGFQMTIAKELAPVLGPVIEGFIQWSAANRQVVAAGVKEFVRDLVTSLREVDWKGVIQSVKSFGSSLAGLVEMVGGARNALIILAVVMNAQTIMAMFGMIGSVGRLVWWLGTLTATAIPAAITQMSTLAMAMMSANAGGVTMLGTVGLLVAKLGLLAAAAGAGYAVGGWINDHVVNAGMEAATGENGQTLGGWIYDKTHPEESTGRPSLVGQGQKAMVGGEIKVSFANAPQGMRVDPVGNGPVALNPEVGYRSFATGMP